MKCLTAGAHALLLDVEGGVVRDWDAWLRAERAAGRLAVTDIVPGACTVLLDGLVDPARTAATLTDVQPPTVEDTAVQQVRLDVRWDGPDLDIVADQWSVSPDEVVATLEHCELQVAFSGFAPGFAYLSGLPEGREVSRRESPRTKVPAGSVGLAGPYVGIYPRSSPGGWQLVGSTDAVLFDPQRDPPALLGPGSVIRLVGT